MLSRYWLRGRRRGGCRRDERSFLYVDRYPFHEWGPALGALFLLAHSRFGWIRWVPWALLGLYVVLLGYHVWLRVQMP